MTIYYPASLHVARYEVRRAYTSIRMMGVIDPYVQDITDRLDAMCREITAEIEAQQPELPLVHPSVVEFVEERV